MLILVFQDKFVARVCLSALIILTVIGAFMIPTRPILWAQQNAAAPTVGWKLIWSDEFNGPAGPPDPEKWTFKVGHNGWGNHELENYTSKNAQLDGMGHLIITAQMENNGHYSYTSARITTQKLFSVQYGMIEARIKLPVGRGLWPAFWMLGDNITSVGWPKCGEIDIMENVPQLGPSKIQSTIHAAYTGNSRVYGNGKPYHFPPGQTIQGYHIYGLIWSEQQISFFVDDPKNIFATYTRSYVQSHSETWAFDHPFFLILNLAVGGDWPGKPDSTTVFPASMIVDYVRVYQLENP
jgi:beta-glucanase (GH16 family)